MVGIEYTGDFSLGSAQLSIISWFIIFLMVILKEYRTRVMDSDRYSFVEACMHGSLERVQKVWKSYGPIINNEVASLAFVRAACAGSLDIMNWLLEIKQINPAFGDNDALFYAVENGHVEVVKMLLKMNSIDPCSRKNTLPNHLYTKENYAEMVSLLLEDGRVQLIPYMRTFLEDAIITKDIDLLNVVLTDGRINLHYDNDIAFELAEYSKDARIIEMFKQYDHKSNA